MPLGPLAALSRFLGETRTELGKCTWPWNPQATGPRKYQELLDATTVVAVSALSLATLVTGADLLFAHAIGAFTH